MTEQAYPYGRRLYTATGDAVLYGMTLPGGKHLVRGLVEVPNSDGYGGTCEEEGPVFTVSRVFDEPPVAVRFREVALLEARAKSLRAEIEQMRCERRELERPMREQQERIARHNQLQTLDWFLAKQITHIVVTDGYLPEIKSLDDALKVDPNCSWKRELKLISLFGESNGQLDWRINEYRDGSGSWRPFKPCRSIEEAREVAAAQAAEVFAKYVAAYDAPPDPAKPAAATHNADYLCRIMDNNPAKYPVPTRAAEIVQEFKIKRARVLVDLRKAELAKANADLVAIGGNNEG